MATRVKGTAVISALKYLRETFGKESEDRILAELSEEDRALIGDGALVSTWYPISLLVHIMRLAEKYHGKTVPNLYREMGRASCDYGLTTVYKIFFKVGSPQFIINKASTLYKNYYDTGEMKVVETGPDFAILELTGFADPSVEVCERLMGWMERTLELSSNKKLRSTHSQCVCRGDAVCRFEGRWG